MPYRLVAVALDGNGRNRIDIQDIESDVLLGEMARLSRAERHATGVSQRVRVFRVYEASDDVPLILLLKPDQKRFWTRSMGFRDGDEVALDLFLWQHQMRPGVGGIDN